MKKILCVIFVALCVVQEVNAGLIAAAPSNHVEYFVDDSTGGATTKWTLDAFGSIEMGTSDGYASSRVYTDSVGAPAVEARIETENGRFFSPTAYTNLDYEWMIGSAGGSGAESPVLVHVSTKGFIRGRYEFNPGSSTQGPNDTFAVASAAFTNQTSSGESITNIGVYHAKPGFSIDLEGFTHIESSSIVEDDGVVRSTYFGSFEQTFDWWIMPDLINKIHLGA